MLNQFLIVFLAASNVFFFVACLWYRGALKGALARNKSMYERTDRLFEALERNDWGPNTRKYCDNLLNKIYGGKLAENIIQSKWADKKSTEKGWEY